MLKSGILLLVMISGELVEASCYINITMDLISRHWWNFIRNSSWKRETFWSSRGTRKRLESKENFLMNLQNPKKFNPLDAEKWYSVTRNDIRRAGGTFLLHQHYNGSHIKALMKLYPELMLKRGYFLKFKKKRPGSWKLISNLQWGETSFFGICQRNPKVSTLWVLDKCAFVKNQRNNARRPNSSTSEKEIITQLSFWSRNSQVSNLFQHEWVRAHWLESYSVIALWEYSERSLVESFVTNHSCPIKCHNYGKKKQI